LALAQLEAHVAEGPDGGGGVAAAEAGTLLAAQHAVRGDERGVDGLAHVAIVRALTDAVPLAEIVGANGNVTHALAVFTGERDSDGRRSADVCKRALRSAVVERAGH